MSATETTVSTDVWSEIDPEWIDATLGPFRCVCGAMVGMLDVQGDPRTCEGCGRVYAMQVKVWRSHAPTRPAAGEQEG